MYKRILVPLEHSPYDAAIVEHVRMLANFCGASVVLMHVADGWAARNVKQLNLRESEEMRDDREYLEQTCELARVRTASSAECVLAGGDPSKEIADAAAREDCDLIAMSTHGHRFIKDIALRQRGERGAPPVARAGAARARRASRAPARAARDDDSARRCARSPRRSRIISRRSSSSRPRRRRRRRHERDRRGAAAWRRRR